MNKITKKAKQGMSVRTRTGIFIALYLILLFAFAAFSDPLGQQQRGWITFIPNNMIWITFMFGILFILSFAWLSYFIAKELGMAFLKTSNKNAIIGLTIMLLFIQLLPVGCYLPYVYHVVFHVSSINWWIPIVLFASSSVLAAGVCYGFLYHMVKRAPRTSKFHMVMFPIATIGIAWAFSFIYYLTINHEWSTLLIILVGVCACDIFAFFGGSLFGKHKMAPKISPKKTWEGAVIGIIISTLIILLLVYLIGIGQDKDPFNHRYLFFGIRTSTWLISQGPEWWILILIMAFIIVFSGIFGDLFFSWIKRRVKIKDFSNVLPGHGGILDRIDALMFSSFVFGVITVFVSFIPSIVNRTDCMFLIM